MKQSKVGYAESFSICESEDLKHKGTIQAGLKLVAIGPDGSYAHGNCAVSQDEARSLASAPAIRKVGRHHEVIEDSDGEHWLRHTSGEVAVIEAPLHPSLSPDFTTEFDSDALLQKAHGNLTKLCFGLAHWAAKATGAERCLVYKFHEDWCGEVIAEVVDPSLEPYLGLRYPPTDIPKLARDLYVETGSRHIFSTSKANVPVSGQIDAGGMDLGLALARTVSPYHVEYLRNMGTASTASAALLKDGQLWGLLSLHYSDERAPSIGEFEILQRVSSEFEDMLSSVLENVRKVEAVRTQRMLDSFRSRVAQTMEPFSVLLNSSASLQRMLAAQGIVIVVGAEYAASGQVLTKTEAYELIERHCSDLESGEVWSSNCLSADMPKLESEEIAGAFVVCICQSLKAFIIVNRTELTQTISWGGDPRRVGNDDEHQRYNPRKSFAQWIETVEGQAIAWPQSFKKIVKQAFEIICEECDIGWTDLAVLLRTGMRRMARRRDFIRQNALDTIEGIRTAIAIGAEVGEGRDAAVTALNSSACDAFAMAPAEAVGMSLAEFEQIVGVPLRELGSQKVVATITTVDAGVRNCEIDIGLIFAYEGPNSDNLRVQSFEFRDVTEARRVQDALKAIRDKVLREKALHEEYFAKLSHELRTPLNVLLGISELLKVDPALGEKQSKKIGSINTAARHMQDLLENILSEAQFANGVHRSDLRAVPVAAVVREVSELLQKHLSQDGIKIVCQLDDDVEAIGDPRAIRQILFNLIGNAGKFNIPNGQVTVSIEDGKDFVSLKITDTGVGMTPDQLAACRDPYIRFGNRPGSGLGLSISQKLVEAMGGRLEIRSAPGEGTSVEVLLKRQRPLSGTARTALVEAEAAE